MLQLLSQNLFFPVDIKESLLSSMRKNLNIVSYAVGIDYNCWDEANLEFNLCYSEDYGL